MQHGHQQLGVMASEHHRPLTVERGCARTGIGPVARPSVARVGPVAGVGSGRMSGACLHHADVVLGTGAFDHVPVVASAEDFDRGHFRGDLLRSRPSADRRGRCVHHELRA